MHFPILISSKMFATPSTTQTTRENWGARGVLFAIILGGLLLRLYRLGVPSLWLDEMGQIVEARGSLLNALLAAQRHHGAAPLDYLITSLTANLNQSDFALRLPSAIWGTLAIYWIYRLGKLVYARDVGIIAAFLLATSPFHIRYSQELRFYALFFLWILITSELAWRAYHNPRPTNWLWYGITATLMLYTHYFAILVLALHGIGVFLACLQERSDDLLSSPCLKRKLLGFAAAAGFALLLFSPWIVFDALRETGLPEAPKPTFGLEIPRLILGAFNGHSQVLGWITLFLAGVGLIATFARNKAVGLLAFIWLVAPIFLILYLDQQKQYFFNPRQYFFVFPIYLLLVSAGVFVLAIRLAAFLQRAVHKKVPASLVVAGLLLSLTIFVLPSLKIYYIDQERYEHGKELAYIIQKNVEPNDVIVVVEPYEHIVYYFAPEMKERVQRVTSVEQLQALYDSGATLWLLTTPFFPRWRHNKPFFKWANSRKGFQMNMGSGSALYLLKKGMDEAFFDKRIASMHIPEQPVVLGYYGDAVRKFGRWDLALNAHEKAAELLPNSRKKAEQLMEAGFDAIFAGEIDRALADLNLAAKLNPSDDEIAIRKGLALLNANRAEEAVIELEHARDDLHSDSYWTFFLLGQAYRKLGRNQDAIDAYSQALAIKPDAHQVRFWMAETYRALGEEEIARQWYRDYLDHAPNGPFAKQANDRLNGL